MGHTIETTDSHSTLLSLVEIYGFSIVTLFSISVCFSSWLAHPNVYFHLVPSNLMVRARIEKGEITNQITTGELDTPLLTPCWPAEWMTLLIQILCFPFILIYCKTPYWLH